MPRTCLVEIDGAGYSVPRQLVGQMVEVRWPVVADRAGQRLQIRAAGQLIVEHAQVGAGAESWEPAHRAAVEHLALTRHGPRRHLHPVDDEPIAAAAENVAAATGDVSAGLGLGHGDFDVAPVDLTARLGLADGDDARDTGGPA